jgi:hypothetical protein
MFAGFQFFHLVDDVAMAHALFMLYSYLIFLKSPAGLLGVDTAGQSGQLGALVTSMS